MPVTGVISDGEETRGSAVAFVFPGVPHQRCQFHSLKDATKPLYEADQHAKTQLKKQLRGVRPIERAEDSHKTPENEAIRGYCLAVRASLTDDGRSPLHPSGLKLHHERRATGRRGAIPGVVVRGSVRVITAVVTKQQSFSAEELRPGDYQRWRDLRAHLQQGEETRRQQFRFRKDPAAYLAALEAQPLM